MSPRQPLTTTPYAMNVPDGAVRLAKIDASLWQAILPIGTILAWHKSMSGTPGLPANFVECNGQTLDAVGSPYHGQVIPNLNGIATGSFSPDMGTRSRMFLRGGTTSGVGQPDQFASHCHSYGYVGGGPYYCPAGSHYGLSTNWVNANTGSIGGTETRPVNMSVVWIMKIK